MIPRPAPRMGWTLNFGQPLTWIFIVVLLVGLLSCLLDDVRFKFGMKKYRSKISAGLVFFIFVVLGGTSTIMIINNAWAGLVINLVVIGFIIYLFSSTYYIINQNDLIVKSGFIINLTIRIDKIKKIAETNNPLSSPATSLDRIAIYYNKSNSVMISPREKADFINKLLHINGQIEVVLKR